MTEPETGNPFSENLLHYAWQGLRFNTAGLRTTQGQSVEIRSVGVRNADAGPDFLRAEIFIDGRLLKGAVELHLRGRDWYTHGHQFDPAYNSVILHVVLEPAEQPIQRADLELIPELSLADLLHPDLHSQWQAGPFGSGLIPCGERITEVGNFQTRRWLQSLGLNRMIDKAERLAAEWEDRLRDWNEALWVALLAYMAGPVNQEAFATLGRRLPFRVVARHADSPLMLEALLMGAAGLLAADPQDDYHRSLQEQWEWLRVKYALDALPPGEVRFMRMRPVSFPTVRLAQVAGIVAQLYQKGAAGSLGMLITTDLARLKDLLRAPVSPYWVGRFRFGPAGGKTTGLPGKDLLDRLIANVIVPYGILYHRHRGQLDAAEQVTSLLQKLPAESNSITRHYEHLGLKPRSALEAQGMIALFRGYCTQSRCRECTIGYTLLGLNK